MYVEVNLQAINFIGTNTSTENERVGVRVGEWGEEYFSSFFSL